MEESVNTEELLKNARWMEVLARAQVSDRGLAEDVVQETWLAACRRPPAILTRAWLRRVLVNLAFRSFRTESARRRRERAVSRPDCAPTTEALVERVEVQRRVVDAVLALDEPLRSTVLLRFFEGLRPVEIAARLGTPATTVRSRIKTALALLRDRLDRAHGGDRQLWCGAILAGTSSVDFGVEAVACEAATTSSALAVGGITMTTKSLACVAALCALSLAVGVGLGHLGTSVSPDSGRSASEETAIAAELERVRAGLATARRERDAFESTNRRLHEQVEALSKSIAAADATGAGGKDASDRERQATASILAGSLRDHLPVATADWAGIAAAFESYHAVQVKALERQREGSPPDELEDALRRSARDIMRALGGLAPSLIDVVPTHAPGNGEFTHPLVLANTLAALLERTELPLTATQKDAIATAVESFESEYDATQERYADATPKLRKVVDELCLKQGAMAAFWDQLNDEQANALSPVHEVDRLGLAICSPLLIATSVKVREYDDRAAALVGIREFATSRYGLTEAQQIALSAVFDTWADEVLVLSAESPSLADAALPPRAEHVAAAGAAHARLLEAIVEMVGLDAEAARPLLEDASWIAPMIRR